MNKELIKILGLPADASDTAIVDAVRKLIDAAFAAAGINEREAAISKKIVESHFALTREQAILSLENQATFDAQRAAAAKSKPKKA